MNILYLVWFKALQLCVFLFWKVSIKKGSNFILFCEILFLTIYTSIHICLCHYYDWIKLLQCSLQNKHKIPGPHLITILFQKPWFPFSVLLKESRIEVCLEESVPKNMSKTTWNSWRSVRKVCSLSPFWPSWLGYQE